MPDSLNAEEINEMLEDLETKVRLLNIVSEDLKRRLERVKHASVSRMRFD